MTERTTAEIAKNYDTLRDFMRGEYQPDEIRNIAEHGADAGWPHITYTTDAAALCDEFEDEITQLVSDQADEYGFKTAIEFVGSFNRADMAGTINGFKNLLVWFAVEHYAQELAYDCDDDEEDDDDVQ